MSSDSSCVRFIISRGGGLHLFGEGFGQEAAGGGLFGAGDVFGRALGDDLAPFVGCAGAEVDDPVGGLHHLQVVLDHDQRMADGQAGRRSNRAIARRRRSAGRWSARRA